MLPSAGQQKAGACRSSASESIGNADKELADALTNIGSDFKSNELAYLATTTKVECPFRDRLAFRLHQQYEPAGLLVAREWNRIDLAVLDSSGSPHCLVELKAMYTFDALTKLRFFTDATSADELKAQRHARDETSVYSLLLVTHLNGVVEEKFRKPVKYSAAANRAVHTYRGGERLRKYAAMAINNGLKRRKLITKGKVAAGSAFGLDVLVLYWLVRNERA